MAHLKSSVTLINLKQMNDLINIIISSLDWGKSGVVLKTDNAAPIQRIRKGWSKRGLMGSGVKKRKRVLMRFV